MPRSSGAADPCTGSNKRQKVPIAWDVTCRTFIKAADAGLCTSIQSKLENLLEEVKRRKVALEQESKDSALSYEGDDAIECECGDTFEV